MPERRPPAAAVISCAGLLDLDHAGAEIGQDLATERRGDAVAELHDGEAGERPAGW